MSGGDLGEVFAGGYEVEDYAGAGGVEGVLGCGVGGEGDLIDGYRWLLSSPGSRGFFEFCGAPQAGRLGLIRRGGFGLGGMGDGLARGV